MRYFKSIGLGFKTPKTAIEGNYVDKKCPFTGNVSIRGRILTGIVVSTKMKRTIIVRRDYLQYIKKYRRFSLSFDLLLSLSDPLFSFQPSDSRNATPNWLFTAHLPSQMCLKVML